MKPSAYKCVRCKAKIPLERVYAAKSRGHEPKFCSDPCRYAEGSKTYRKKQRGADPAAKAKPASKAAPAGKADAASPAVVDVLAELDRLMEGDK